jgi:(1->4)-alpha-D-glucan 1-alpha-D-glucosylmutase
VPLASGADAINYRRFFDVNDLAVIRVDRREVYDRVHALVFELIGAGLVEGLRLDHIDGLKDPAGYLQRLQADASAAAGAKPFYLLVEKILGPGEALRRDWPVAGTTGYEFANLVTGLQVDAPEPHGCASAMPPSPATAAASPRRRKRPSASS